MPNEFSFRSFYFCFGTTSFRMSNFNLKIERQLQLLNDFWNLPENENEKWEANETIQERYYYYMKENDFLNEGDAPRKAKDARQKTSGLVDIGLLDSNRRLTEIGKKLLHIANKGDFSSDNFLQIPRDSFIYLQQLLKSHIQIGNFYIRPFIILCKLLSQYEHLTQNEFMYLFPLCTDEKSFELINNKLWELRDAQTTINDIIVDVIMCMENYKNALDYFLSCSKISSDTFCTIGFNRKSREYDRAYYPLYEALKKVYFDNNNSRENILELYEASNIKNMATHWRSLLFDTSSSASIKKDPFKHLRTNLFSNCNSIEQFKTVFYKTMHLFKTKRTLEDYFDLNRRYLKISDTLLFDDNHVAFDILPKYYFSDLSDDFYTLAFQKSDDIEKDLSFVQISPALKYDESKILKALEKDYNVSFTKIADAKNFLSGKRLERFNQLIDEKFTDSKLIELLNLFEVRNDKEIQNLVTDAADTPTIFEYILGIIWYKISERHGDILSYLNLSLEADLLPKTHAGGGEADIVYQYSATENFPEHYLLIEATLADSTNQRRMEMEPVSRHLGDYILSHESSEAYCVFITNFLHINVIADFRNRKNSTYYNSDGSKQINGMMITPLESKVLKLILQKGIKYKKLYPLFNKMHDNDLQPKEWYEKLKEEIDNLQSTTNMTVDGLQPSTDNQQPVQNKGNYKSLTTEKDVEKFIDSILKSKEKCVAFDCETDGLETWKANILGFSLCCKKGEGVYVPVASSDGLFSSDGISTEFMVQQLTRLFENEEVTVVMHNGKFDYECLIVAARQVRGTREQGEGDVSTALDMTRNNLAPHSSPLTPKCKIFDTMVAAWVLNPERNGKFAYSLETLAETQLHLKGIEYDDIVGKGQTFRDVPLDVATNYCAEDSDFTLQLYKLFEPQLREQKLDTLFWQTEMKLLPILAEMELRGIHIDTAAMNKYNKELTKKISAAEKNIYAEVGHEFNIASTKQLQEVLFTERKLPTGKKTKTGYSTDTSVLEEQSHYDAVPRMILEYRELSKLQSTYVESLPKLCDANGRIHTSFIQTGTATGRLSSRDPNLQNIPVRNEEGRRIRSAFTASEGTVLISADYSQIELVVLAHLSGDENMCRAFTDGTDIHRATAALIFGVDANDVTPDMRRTAKTINFGVIYGMSAFRLANELEISRSQAKTFIDSYFAQYESIKNFMDGIVRGAEEKGYVETIFGRRRNITNINSRNKMEKAASERVAINTPVQGSAADIVKKAMLDVDAALREKQNGAALLLQVHDELILECPDDEATVSETVAVLREKMENAVKLRVPLRVSVEVGKAWGEFH